MNKIHLFQKLPYFIKVAVASVRGWQLKRLRTPKREAYLQEIREHEQWTKAQIAAFQQEQLREILAHAVQHVPYYRELWKTIALRKPGADPLDLSNWPILEKDTLRQNPDAFIAEDISKKKLTHIPTSGTSGKPMNYWFDEHTISYWYAMYEHRIRNWNGVSEKDRWANVGGQLICAVDQNKPPFWIWNQGMKQLYLSSYHITPENVKFYLDALTKHRITYLLGYVSSIYNIAREGLRQNLPLPKLKLVITNAEPLFQHQRETIEKAFECRVCETYSSCEFAFGANQDPDGKMYVWPEAGIIELMDDEGNLRPEGRGQLVVTGLLNKAMPLIRFRLGDTATLSQSPEGRLAFDTFSEITGRTDDLVVTSDGKLVGRLDPVFKSDLKIKESQIIQEELDLFKIVLVPDTGFSETDTRSIESRLKDRVGSNVKVVFEIMDQIPRGANGKFKAVVSKITSGNK